MEASKDSCSPAKLHKENRPPLSTYEEKELCKATRKMIERAQRNPDSLLDRAIERIMMKGFQSNEARTFKECLDIINLAMQDAMEQVLNNENFHESHKKRERDYREERDRRDHSPREESDKRDRSPSRQRKEKRHSPLSSSSSGKVSGTTDNSQPLCNGCGKFLFDKHTDSTCWYIRNRLEGWNKDYKSVPCKKSEAAKKLRESGKSEDELFLTIPKDHRYRVTNLLLIMKPI